MLHPSKLCGVPRQLKRCSLSLLYAVMEVPALPPFINVTLKFASSSSAATAQKLSHCYEILKVPTDCSFEDVKRAFIALAKKYHPDGGSPDADAKKFQEVESAYRILQQKYISEDKDSRAEQSNDSSSDVFEFDIKHTAPQHRQYLSYHGYGTGTPFQRQKQHQKMRAVQAADNLISHRIQKINLNCDSKEEALTIKDKVEARKIKTRFGMDRLVEDLIQESMARGDFDNLRGSGRPLKDDKFNPYVDFVTHKLNEVLIENGFTPEWITLQKEIRMERDDFRSSLHEKRRLLGPVPLSFEEQQIWQTEIDHLQPLVSKLNAKINKYNLLVPILNKQMLQIQLEREARRILETGEANTCGTKLSERASDSPLQPKYGEGFLDLLSYLLGVKR